MAESEVFLGDRIDRMRELGMPNAADYAETVIAEYMSRPDSMDKLMKIAGLVSVIETLIRVGELKAEPQMQEWREHGQKGNRQ